MNDQCSWFVHPIRICVSCTSGVPLLVYHGFNTFRRGKSWDHSKTTLSKAFNILSILLTWVERNRPFSAICALRSNTCVTTARKSAIIFSHVERVRTVSSPAPDWQKPEKVLVLSPNHQHETPVPLWFPSFPQMAGLGSTQLVRITFGVF